MTPGNPAGLLRLADREFRALSEAHPEPPSSQKFKPIKMNRLR